MHYDPEDFEHLEIKHEIKDVDMSHYTNERYSSEIKEYLINVHGMNDSQLAYEMEKHFPDLFETTKSELNLLI